MSKKTKLSLIAIAGFVMLLSAGCQIVHVEDKSGKPVFWAAVSTGVEGKKASTLPMMTDLLGNAPLAKSMTKDPEFIQVSKDGYETKTVPRTTESKISVTLDKIGSPKKAESSSYKRPRSSNVSITPKTTDNKTIDSKTTTTDKKQP